MDPVGGPWSAYASYNRLAGVQTGTTSAELHHHLSQTGSAGTPATTTAQLLSSGFLSPPSVGYETVFTPLFHHAGAKAPAHYVQQHRQALAQAQAASSKQTAESEYHQAQAFFEQGGTAWQQNSPFGILPHESVAPSTTSSSKPGASATYENFNAHFVAAQNLNQLNSQIAAATAKARAQSPQITTTIKSTTQPNSASFFQSSSTYSGGNGDGPNNKPFSSNSSNLQQSCIVSSSPNTSVTRVPQNRTIYLGSPTPARANDKPSFNNPAQSKNTPLIQTKAQTKIYPELSNHSERRQPPTDAASQSSPISFSIMDAAGRLNYAGSNSSAKRPQFQHSSNYRHYQSGNNPESDFQRSKSSSDYSNSPDCNVVVPRRPSPLQAHSQASPLGHVPSPAYPMYNSPLNSISSPQNSNQVTPPSPLDVTVSRSNAPQAAVSYPSVITRTLNDKAFSDRFDQRTPQTNQNCWDERRKFSNQSNTPINNNYTLSNNMEVATNRTEQQHNAQQHRNLTNDRQQNYFDTGQHQGGATAAGALQDLSSCRGDPMSIVKNLQQQSCQVQQPEIKQEIKAPTKRRKSNENKINSNNSSSDITGPTLTDYFAGRIPPPAHSSTANQQQNGAYFDFDSRWIPPPATSKIFGTQAIHQQHQGLMVPHPHPHHPPPLPYFTPFHLAPHPDFPQSVEIAPITPYNEQHHNQPSSSHFVQQESSPKVVVPNIEEELNFLSEGTPRIPSTVTSQPAAPRPVLTNTQQQPNKSESVKGPTAGFMNSYLKFLQGERDNSPPPASRGNRKQSWPRTKPFQQQPLQQSVEVKQESNGIPSTPPPPPPVTIPTTTSSSTTRLSQGDPQDDPRYFPLPKERKKNRFDSSDDGFSSDEDLFTKKVAMAIRPEPPREKLSKKGRPSKPSGSERKRPRSTFNSKKDKNDVETKDVQTFLPRRETSKRAAKEKTSMQQLIAKQTVDEDLEEPAEFIDSDSDPAWTPQARDDPEEEIILKKGKKSKHSNRKRISRNFIGSYDLGIEDVDEYSNDSHSVKKQRSSSNKQVPKQNSAPTLEDNIAAAVAQQNSIPTVTNDDNPYKTGEFVAIKSELSQEWPPIWRVDGKSLLQKYEPFDLNGKMMYKNISTYTSWTPESKKQYTSVPVKYHSQSQLESIVEFLRKEMVVIDYQFMEQAMKESEIFQDNFEVYIQTLISQALDSNFLMEIFQEQDEYFLTNVKTIDDITDSRKFKMINMLHWPSTVQVAVTTWPCFNVIHELSAADTQFRPCAACLKQGVAVRVLMYGQPYNSTTLEGCQPSTQIVEKDFLMCRICASQVELFNKITHQKYLMYIECAKRVTEKRSTDPHKDTTCILNELLADENWLTQLFNDVRNSWAEVDSLERSYRFKNSIQ